LKFHPPFFLFLAWRPQIRGRFTSRCSLYQQE